MKVLIIGGTGFVGSSVVRRFLKMNDEVHVIIRKSSNLWRINAVKDQVNLHSCNIASRSNLEKSIDHIKPEVVINCSGIVKGFGLKDQDFVIQSNLVNTINIVNASLHSGVDTLIHTGSAYECGFSKEPTSSTNCSGLPIGLYGIVKKAETEYIQMVSKKYNKTYINVRLFTPFGYFDSITRLIPYVITSLIQGKSPRINNPGAGRSFIFMEDVSKVYHAIANKPEKFYSKPIVNLGAQSLTKISQMVSILYSLFDLDYIDKTHYLADSEEFLYSDPVDIRQLLSLLSINLMPLNDALVKTIEWFKENSSFYDSKLLT